jgi:Ca2+-binding RTX toxin-like protein
VNQNRLAMLYGAQAANDVVVELQALIQSAAFAPNVGGILFVDSVAAYQQFDVNPCDPNAANGVVEAINSLVDQQPGVSSGQLKHIVVVGSDDVIPFARTPDVTRISNEFEYATTIADTRSGTWGALATGSILTDDPYGDFDPIPWLNRYLYVPDVALGRLVESPGEIIAQLELYQDAGGSLDPDTALVTGYDFLEDGSMAVTDNLGFLDNITQLINDTWDRIQLLAGALPAGSAPADVISLNAHFDHYRLLPADENFAPSPNNDDELVYSTEFEGLQANDSGPTPRIIFSMGCHSGLSLADYLVGSAHDPRASDWAQVFARNGAVFVGQTGFGYGDTLSVALSERLMSLYAKKLDSNLTVGEALTFAKQDYFATLGLYGVYDEKALMESVFYGLPMYQLGGAAPPAIHELDRTNDPATGLSVARVRVHPDLDREPDLGEAPSLPQPQGEYFAGTNASSYDDLVEGSVGHTAEAGTQNTHYRPIQPRLSFDVSQSEVGVIAHGAVIEALSADNDISPFDPIFHIPVVDEGGREPERSSSDGAFPARLQSLASYTAPDGPRQNLVLIPGQFFFDANGAGTQRTFNELDVTVYYSTNPDREAPHILRTDAAIYPDTVEFVVDTLDGEGSNVRVVVLYRDASGTWTKIELNQEGNTKRWVGEDGAVLGGADLDYFVQVVDSSGNVGVSSAKGTYFVADPVQPPSTVGEAAISVLGEELPDGQFNRTVEVGVTGKPGVVYTYSLDGEPPVLYEGPVAVATDGLHSVIIFGTDGSRAVHEFAIQRVGNQLPAISITGPADGAVYDVGQDVIADYACEDVGNGLASCVGTLANGSSIDTSSVGLGSFTVTATDNAGRSNVVTVTYAVGSACSIAPTIVGTSGDDVINGTPGADVIHGNGGNDIINGNGGNDIICTGSGADQITTLGGHDLIDAGNGDNIIHAGDGSNEVRTGKDDDAIITGAGNDVIAAGNGDNIITDSGGRNSISAGKDDDSVHTTNGDDVIDVGNGNNEVDAGAGNNLVTAGKDDDTIFAGDGDDVIQAGNGNNLIQAGGGTNSVTAGKDNDSIHAGGGDDTIDAGNGTNVIEAGGGANVIRSGKDDDRITTGPGNDDIEAGNGDNIIEAGDGNNTVKTGKDDDQIATGSGSDVIIAGNGANVVTSGAGDDSIDTGKDADTVDADGGFDTCTLGKGANVAAGCEVE